MTEQVDDVLRLILDKSLPRAAQARLATLGWTHEDLACRVYATSAATTDQTQVVRALMHGQTSFLTHQGFNILSALGLHAFEPVWDEGTATSSSTKSGREEVRARFTSEEFGQLQQRAERVKLSLPSFVRNATLLELARKQTQRPTASQLRAIQAEATAQGHLWTLEELQARQLPLFWNEDWTRTQLSEGHSASEIALLAGNWPIRNTAHYIRNVYGIELFKPRLRQEEREIIKARASAGEKKTEIAAELGISRFVVAYHAQGAIATDQRTRNFLEKADQIRHWPAATQTIAEVLFGGSGNRASSWCRDMVKSGRLVKVDHGWYDRVPLVEDAQ